MHSGLEMVDDIMNKGRGVIATSEFEKDEFVVEYKGELISKAEGNRRSNKYSADPSIGSFIYTIGDKW